MQNNVERNYLVSAIVSVYNCERFIAGCLEDLESQTIADRLEIVVVNTGSQQNEEPIVKEFQAKYDNIVYIKTENRETIYQAWNRGIKAASGKYITNANTDDRHRKDALETMANLLENDKSIDLVYADVIVTDTENETFEDNTPAGYYNWSEFDRNHFLFSCNIGPQPMWRKSLHEKFNYFDETLKVAGDYEFWLRLSEQCKFKHINEYLGLYLRSPYSASLKNSEVTLLETECIINKYIKRVAHDKNLLKEIKKRQWEKAYSLGRLYSERKQPFLAIKAFSRSISHKWNNLASYTGLLSCFLPVEIVEVLRKNKRNLTKRLFAMPEVSRTIHKHK